MRRPTERIVLHTFDNGIIVLFVDSPSQLVYEKDSRCFSVLYGNNILFCAEYVEEQIADGISQLIKNCFTRLAQEGVLNPERYRHS